jgi:hypothetical protein
VWHFGVVVVQQMRAAAAAADLATYAAAPGWRRKGMSEDVSVAKFFNDPMLLELAKQDTEFQQMAF